MKERDILLRFAENLERLRKRANFTQSELAEKSEVSAKYVSQLENATRNPSMEIVYRLSRALGVEVSEFFSDRGKMDCEYRARINKILGKRDDKTLSKVCKVIEVIFDET